MVYEVRCQKADGPGDSPSITKVQGTKPPGFASGQYRPLLPGQKRPCLDRSKLSELWM